jgi:hypothetical protein
MQRVSGPPHFLGRIHEVVTWLKLSPAMGKKGEFLKWFESNYI